MIFKISMIIILCCIVILVGCIYVKRYHSKGTYRIHQLLKLKKEYATQVNKPKRLIIGGSDVLYCFNTDRISEKTGIPTVNFGINVGLGIGFLLEEAFPLLTKGDDVILCLAYSLYSNPAHYLFAHDFYRMYAPYKLTQFTWSQHLIYTSRNIQLNMGYKQKSFHLSKSGAYVNVKGSHLPEGKYKPLVFSSHFSQTEAVRELDEFVQKCAEKKIRVRITYPSTLFFSEYKDSDYLTELDTYLRKHYEVIGKPLDYMVPRESIFNSVYHVNEVGQDDRTQRFIKEIKEEQYHV